MPDDRTQIQKLEAMASQTRSPEEALIAEAFLTKMRSRRQVGLLSREAILGQKDRPNVDERIVAVFMPDGWTKFAYDDVPWDEVREYHMKVRM